MPNDELYYIALSEPRPDLFLCYVAGRLTGNEEAAQTLIDFYKEWKFKSV